MQSNNILNSYIAKYQPTAPLVKPESVQSTAIPVVQYQNNDSSTNLLTQFLNQSAINASVQVKKPEKVSEAKSADLVWRNDLRSMFKDNKAVIMAVIPRTMNAKDLNGDDMIDGNEQRGTFINAVERLDEIKALGVNTLHVLPIHPPGKTSAMGLAGSLYSPEDFLKIDPALHDKNAPGTVEEQFKYFIDEAHKKDIRVMIDLPSCGSYDMFLNNPELMAFERNGLAKTPQGWNDIRMLSPWKDETKKELNPAVLDLHKKYVDMCVNYGADGIRADVARAKPSQFWDIIIPYSRKIDPEFAWLAETYTYEDASPQVNMPYDRPEDLLRAGFDSYYGQYHIFHEWTKASELTDYVKENLEMSNRLDKGKSLIGSFGTHDDQSLMFHGGANFHNLVTGLQVTLPMTNPYFVDGYQSGDDYVYKYENALGATSMTDSNVMTVHHGRLDIFNFSRKPGGKNPEIGDFMKESFKMREKYNDVTTKGSFIPLKTTNKEDQIISYARHLNGKTLLVIANRDINHKSAGEIEIPGLSENQTLTNLLPTYGENSKLQAENGKVKVDLAPSRIHVFEINTPNIEQSGLEVLKQNL